jgi:hypothetical protein
VANSRREVCYKWKRRHSRGRQTAAEMVQTAAPNGWRYRTSAHIKNAADALRASAALRDQISRGPTSGVNARTVRF